MDLKLEPYAVRLLWRFPEDQPLERWQALFADLLEQLAIACNAGGAKIIGHIKGIALLSGGGFLRGSKVSLHYPPDVEAKVVDPASFAGLEILLNVLVYGLPLPEARRLLGETVQTLASSWGAEQEILPAADLHQPSPDHR